MTFFVVAKTNIYLFFLQLKIWPVASNSGEDWGRIRKRPGYFSFNSICFKFSWISLMEYMSNNIDISMLWMVYSSCFIIYYSEQICWKVTNKTEFIATHKIPSHITLCWQFDILSLNWLAWIFSYFVVKFLSNCWL